VGVKTRVTRPIPSRPENLGEGEHRKLSKWGLARSLSRSQIFTARCYAERGYATVCRLSVFLSVHPSLSVTFRYRDHMLKYFENNSTAVLRFMLELTPTWAIWSNGHTHPKLGRNRNGVMSTKPAIAPKRCEIGRLL